MKDLNDNRQIFEQSVYNATVRESLPIGSSIVTLRASDLDHDANGKVTYILESEGEDNFFRIDANSGVISLRSALDRELQAQHILNIVATGKSYIILLGHSLTKCPALTIVTFITILQTHEKILRLTYLTYLPMYATGNLVI